MTLTDTTLAADFAPATREAWLGLVAKTLKGAGVETLARETPGGVMIQPLYTRDVPAAEGDLAVPRRAAGGWDLRAPVRHPDRDHARAEVAEALAGGAASVVLRIDPTGADGIALGSADDLGAVLEGVLLDVAPVALDAGFLGPRAADWLAAVAKASPAAASAFHIDPISAFAARGASPGPMESHLISAANTVARLCEAQPRATGFLASGRVAHAAGASPAEEIALAAGAAVAYARAQHRAGAAMRDAFARIVLGLAVEAEPFIAIAKLRAARLVWARITQACAVEGLAARIEARTSERMLTRADPFTNLIRVTSAGFAAAVGGADALVLGAFTDAIGLPTAFARRMARNTGLILAEEAHLGAVEDPLAGAWAIEALTGDLARAAWAKFVALEAAGGVLEALRAGVVAKWAAATRAALAAGLADKSVRVIGVTDFVNKEPGDAAVETFVPAPVAAPDPRLPGPDSHCPALAPVTLEALAA